MDDELFDAHLSSPGIQFLDSFALFMFDVPVAMQIPGKFFGLRSSRWKMHLILRFLRWRRRSGRFLGLCAASHVGSEVVVICYGIIWGLGYDEASIRWFVTSFRTGHVSIKWNDSKACCFGRVAEELSFDRKQDANNCSVSKSYTVCGVLQRRSIVTVKWGYSAVESQTVCIVAYQLPHSQLHTLVVVRDYANIQDRKHCLRYCVTSVFIKTR